VELPADPTAPPAPLPIAKALGAGCLAWLGYLAVSAVVGLGVFVLLTPSGPPVDIYHHGPGGTGVDVDALYRSIRPLKSAGEIADLFALPVGALVVLVLAGRLGVARRELLALRWPSWRQALLWTAAFAALDFGYPYAARLAGFTPNPEGYLVREYPHQPMLPVYWLIVVFLGPVFEEILFRGLLFGGLARSRLGAWPALALISLLFAAAHFPKDLFYFGNILAYGLLFTAARFATGSLYLAMGLHSAANFVAMAHVALYLYTRS